MFSRDITSSDAFLDMPSSSQSLYFHLGMEADDDGFIGNPKKVMRVIGVGDDDFKILLAKRFLLDFPSGVIVVKHHRINNNWDKYNCKRTMYTEEFSQLNIKENKAYTLDKSQGLPVQSENSLKTVFRIEENRIDKNTVSVAVAPQVVEVLEVSEESKKPRAKPKYPHSKEVFALWPSAPKNWALNTTQLRAAENLYEEHGIEEITSALLYIKNHKDEEFCPQISTPYDLDSKWLKLEAFYDKKHA